jgi:hypothetical protein
MMARLDGSGALDDAESGDGDVAEDALITVVDEALAGHFLSALQPPCLPSSAARRISSRPLSSV